MDADLAQTASMVGRIVVGGGTLLAPRTAGALLGVDPDANPAVSYVGRLFGVRAVLMVVLLAGADGDERRRQLRWGIAVDLVDAAAAAAAGRSGHLPRRAAVLGTAAALLEVGLGWVAVSGGRASRQR